MRPSSVCVIAYGCSWISFCMKWRYWPRSTESADSSLSRTSRSAGRPSRADDAERLAAHLGDIAFLEEQEPARHGQERGHVGGDEILIDAEADDDRAALARKDDAFRILLADDRERIRAFEFGDGLAHGGEQRIRRRQVLVDAVGNDLGVGVRAEFVALRLQIGA